MARRPTVYGLDIETDTTVNGLDPEVAPILTVALSNPAFDEVFSGDEATIIEAIDERLSDVAPGVVATWNGASFDLPFIAQRAAVLGLPLGLRLRYDPSIRMHHQPLPGHEGAYRAR